MENTQKMMIIEMKMNSQINSFALNGNQWTNTDYIGYKRDRAKKYRIYIVGNVFFIRMMFQCWWIFFLPLFFCCCGFWCWAAIHVRAQNSVFWSKIDSAHISFHLSIPPDAWLMLLSYHFHYDYSFFTLYDVAVFRAFFFFAYLAVCSMAPRDLCSVIFK